MSAGVTGDRKEIRRLRAAEGIAWFGIAVALTAGLVAVRAHIGLAHVTLAYLMLVLAASARLGRRVGLSIAAACFLAFNFFFVPPYGAFTVHDPLNWLVLLAFFGTGAIAAQLLHRAQDEALRATARANEILRLAELGAEALQAPRAEDALLAIARVIREELRVDRCEIFLKEADHLRLGAGSPPDGAGESGSMQVEADLLLSTDARTVIVPLKAHDRQVGLLRLTSSQLISPQIARHPFAEALAYYAALGVERIRLTDAATHADALRAADKLKDAVLSAVSHDLRTPLTSIKALANQIAQGGDSRAEAIEIEADRLNRYVTNLLDLSRLNAGGVSLSLELVPAEDLLGAAIRQLLAIAPNRNVRVQVDHGENILAGVLDFVVTLRALGNILENAVRYSPEDSVVDVRASQSDNCMEIEISDRGPGIPDDEREIVFEPFRRGVQHHATIGTGLGLTIARRFIEAQNGTLSFLPREGGGSTFRVRLPNAEIGRESL